MSEPIDEMFGDLFYPGSKQKRRPAPVADVEQSWDAHPVKRLHHGEEKEFFAVGALAQALGKSTITLRNWERKSYIPTPSHRLPGWVDANGVKHLGKRVYTRAHIEIAIEEFAKRGLLGSARVEWKYHDDLTIALLERWKSVTD